MKIEEGTNRILEIGITRPNYFNETLQEGIFINMTRGCKQWL
jgi:hypothetical protein